MKVTFASRAAIRATVTLAIALGGLLVVPQARAELKSLKRAPMPLPANLGDVVANRGAAVQLGKALFWDMQTGGDGVQACASCHFQAGADTRTRNILNPGANGGPVAGGASWRMVVDFSDLRRSFGMYPGGQSEDPASLHYNDQTAPWAAGRYLPLYFYASPKEFEAGQVESVLVLEPK